jgi:hypothetical protein
MADRESWLLELRMFKVQPGTREEFHRISDEGTIPMMRRYGIKVVKYGPALNDENTYFLLRAFPSEEQRVAQSQALYANAEWEENYDGPVMSMIDEYHTVVMPASEQMIEQLVGAG